MDIQRGKRCYEAGSSHPSPPAACPVPHPRTSSCSCSLQALRPLPGSTPTPSPAQSAPNRWRRTAGEQRERDVQREGGAKAEGHRGEAAGVPSEQRWGSEPIALGYMRPPSLPLRPRVPPDPPPPPQVQPCAVPLRAGLLLAVRAGHGAGSHVDQHRGTLVRRVQGRGGGAGHRGAAVRWRGGAGGRVGEAGGKAACTRERARGRLPMHCIALHCSARCAWCMRAGTRALARPSIFDLTLPTDRGSPHSSPRLPTPWPPAAT